MYVALGWLRVWRFETPFHAPNKWITFIYMFPHYSNQTPDVFLFDYKGVTVILIPFACSHIIAMCSEVVLARCISKLISLYPLITAIIHHFEGLFGSNIMTSSQLISLYPLLVDNQIVCHLSFETSKEGHILSLFHGLNKWIKSIYNGWKHMKIIFVHCGWRKKYRIDPCSYEHYWTSSNCEDRFYIRFFNRSAHKWISYVYSHYSPLRRFIWIQHSDQLPVNLSLFIYS